MRKIVYLILILLTLMLFISFVFRESILRFAGQMLIEEDMLKKADAIVVLSGGAFDRGQKGYEIYHQGYANKIICPGGNIDYTYLIVFGDTIFESDLTKKRIQHFGINDSSVIAIHSGKSTLEEAKAVLDYCHKNNYQRIIVVSTYFHTARAKRVYRKVFKDSGIEIIIHGSKSVYFDENYWWRDEYGLINFNNEVLKNIYYFLKGV